MKNKAQLKGKEDMYSLHLPNTWNCIQSAIYQLSQLQPQPEVNRAISDLESAKKSLSEVKLS